MSRSLRARPTVRSSTVATLSGLALVAATASTTSAQTTWSEPSVLVSRSAHAAVWDPSLSRVLAFGGNSTTGAELADTWAWDGSGWTKLAPATAPGARAGFGFARDDARNESVLFGGIAGQTLFDETWTWDGTAGGDWTLEQPGNIPDARRDCALAYDASRQRVVLFGGRDDGSFLADTWEWDGTDWSLQSPVTSPSPRFGHALAYDAARQRVVLLGGYDGSPRADTWEWDGTNWSLATPTTAPSARFDHALAWDAQRSRIVAFGGRDGLDQLDDTWEFDGTTWAQVATATVPAARQAHALAWDDARDRVVMLGGLSGVARADTWEYDGVDWTARDDGRPSARRRFDMAFDGTNGTVLLFGGESSSGGQRHDDTWSFDGSAWSRLAPATSPPARSAHALAARRADASILLFGGTNHAGDTWVWDGTTWTELVPATTPGPRSRHAMAFDDARDRAVLFGGVVFPNVLSPETWEWDAASSTWTQRNPTTSPPARVEACMAYDRLRDRTILFGGASTIGGAPLGDTWEWDGTDWTQLAPATSPPARSAAQLAWSEARGRIVLFGGDGGAGGIDDTWEWDGAAGDWVQLAPLVDAAAQDAGALAYDDARRVLVSFGGTGSDATWEHRTIDAADWFVYGNGCASSAGVPTQSVLAFPWLGEGCIIEAANLPPGATTFLTVGFIRDLLGGTTPLPLSLATIGAPGCELNMDPGFVFPIANPAGSGTATIPIPNDPTLVGLSFYTQTVVLEPGVNALGAVFSAGLDASIGTR